MSTAPVPIFTQATHDQLTACDTLAATAFRGPLSEKEYLEREEYMRGQALANNDGVRTWCLYPKDDPRIVLATCMTFTRPLLLTDRRGSRGATGYCIGSVISHPEYRGQGHASTLLHKVAEWLDGPGDAVASVLYSAKEGFYARVGWEPFPAPGWKLLGSDSNFNAKHGLQEQTRSLRADDIDDLCRRDVQLLSEDISKMPNEDHLSILTVLPTTDLARYQHARAEFHGIKLHGRSPDIKGASHSSESWISWYHDFKKGFLFIQRFRLFDDPNEKPNEILAALLYSALLEAQHWQLSVMVWGTEPSLNDAVESLKKIVQGFSSEFQSQRRETVSVRWRYGEKQKLKVFPDEYYAWN